MFWFNISDSAFYLYKHFIMKKTLGLIAILAIACLALTGCNKENVEIANPASVNCTDNGGTLIPQTDEEWNQYALCELPDGAVCEEWAYLRGECPVNEESISLTNEELEEIIDNNFPTSYTYTVYNFGTEESDSGEYTYPEDFSHTLLIPEQATMASREVVSSAIEDGMIYTDTKVTLQDDTEIKILYIVNPDTMKLVAASVENGNETRNYQFAY